MPKTFTKGQEVFIIESNRWIKKCTIIRAAAGLYTIKFDDGRGGIRVKEHRLYGSEEEAQAVIDKLKASEI